MPISSQAAQGTSGQDATQAAKQPKVKSWAVRKVKQKDGSVMVRLNLPRQAGTVLGAAGKATANQEAVSTRNPLRNDQLLEVMAEPKAMTALASVAVATGSENKPLSTVVDPSSVRNWAEIVDPDLYLRWMAAGVESRYRLAIQNRVPGQEAGKFQGWLTIQFEVPPHLQPGAPLDPTLWSNANAGGKSVEDATREWLTLPMPDPKSNPWLRAGQNYRY